MARQLDMLEKPPIMALVRAAVADEREACAKVTELRSTVFGGEPTTPNERQLAEHIAAHIRARGKECEKGHL